MMTKKRTTWKHTSEYEGQEYTRAYHTWDDSTAEDVKESLELINPELTVKKVEKFREKTYEE